MQDTSLSASRVCSYELLCRVEPSASEAPRARVLRTGIPELGSVRAGVPERFVWSTTTDSQDGQLGGNELVTLKATSITHSIDVYAARLEPGQGFPEQPRPGEEPPPGVFKLQPYEDDANTLYLRLGESFASLNFTFRNLEFGV